MMIFVLILVLGTVAAQDSAENRRFLCGRELARAHSMYCANMDPVPEDTGTHEDLIKLKTRATGGSRLIPERFSHKLRRAADIARFRGALVETCCTKPCLISELLDHC